MIEKILPEGVASAEAFCDPPDAVLYPGEAELITRAVDKRRREFRTVRHCARQALRQLGLPPAPVLRGERGEPLWPVGVVGSMTHCAGYRAAAVAHSRDFRALGLDAEPHQPLPAGVLEIITLVQERGSLSELAAADSAICWDRILFCAKEATYKAWFPLTHRWLGFEDAHITFGVDDGGAAGRFESHILIDPAAESGPPLETLSGRWSVRDDLVLTAIVL